MLHLEHHRRIIGNHALCLGLFIYDTAHHHADDVILGGILCEKGSHPASVSHDRDSVGDDLYLLHTVRDVYDTEIQLAQIPYDLEQILYLSLSKRCGGLIKNDEFCIM